MVHSDTDGGVRMVHSDTEVVYGWCTVTLRWCTDGAQ